MTPVAHLAIKDPPPPAFPPERILALVTVIPGFGRKPRAHYGRILLGPQHLSAALRLYRVRAIGVFGGCFTFAITGVKPHDSLWIYA
jgi:hypothetical protein